MADSNSLDTLIQALKRLPGVGIKSAQRMAFHLLQHDRAAAEALARALQAAVSGVKHCERCHTFTENNENLGYAMMEYVTSRSGLRLYRYSSHDQKTPQHSYFVYKNGKLHLRVTQENALSTLPFFGIKPL